jgi:hypothetical protein
MATVRITKGSAPTHLFVLYQDDEILDLSGGGVAATFRMENVSDSSDTWTGTATGLNASGYMYITFDATASENAGEFLGDIVVTGLTSGNWASEAPIKVVIRDSKGV